MGRKLGQIIARGESTWLVRIYPGRDPQTGQVLNGRAHSSFMRSEPGKVGSQSLSSGCSS